MLAVRIFDMASQAEGTAFQDRMHSGWSRSDPHVQPLSQQYFERLLEVVAEGFSGEIPVSVIASWHGVEVGEFIERLVNAGVVSPDGDDWVVPTGNRDLARQLFEGTMLSNLRQIEEPLLS